MRKLINFVKKPLLYGAIGVFVVFTALLVIISSLKHGKEYEYETNIAGIAMDFTYIFEDKDTLVIESVVLGELSQAEGNYEIRDGVLYSKQEGSTEWEKDGKINAYEIVLESVDEETGLKMEIVMECKANKAVRTLSIVMMCVSGVLAIGAAVVLVLDKKGIIKLKSDAKSEENVEAAPAVETTETAQAQVETEEPAVEPETKE